MTPLPAERLPSDELQPEVAAPCVVCGGGTRAAVCNAAEVEAQLEFIRHFHRRRLRPSAFRPEGEALADRAEFTQDYVTDIVQCTGCGLFFREPRPPAHAVTAAYEADHYGAERLAALFESQLELFRPRVAALRRLLGARTPDVVEVGSFVGGFLAAAGEHGWRALGIDPGAEVTEFCRERGLHVQRATATEAAVAARSADAVVIWNTFDQLPDPRATLRAVRRWLRPRGLLAIRVPNGASFRAAVVELRRRPHLRQPLLAALAWNNLLGFPYLHGYSVETLTHLLEQFGFRCIAVHPDTLTRLADARTRRWAAWEERAIKGVCAIAGRVRPDVAPWFDAYFRLDD